MGGGLTPNWNGNTNWGNGPWLDISPAAMPMGIYMLRNNMQTQWYNIVTENCICTMVQESPNIRITISGSGTNGGHYSIEIPLPQTIVGKGTTFKFDSTVINVSTSGENHHIRLQYNVPGEPLGVIKGVEVPINQTKSLTSDILVWKSGATLTISGSFSQTIDFWIRNVSWKHANS